MRWPTPETHIDDRSAIIAFAEGLQRIRGTAFQPPEEVDGLDWVERHCRFSRETTGNDDEVELYGYQRGIIAAMTDGLHDKVIVPKSTRSGITQCASFAAAFFLAQPDRIPARNSLLSRSAVKLRDLGDYHDAELARKRTTALFGGYYRVPLDDVETVGAAGQDDEDFDIEAIEPGSFHRLPPGYDITFSKPEDVGGNFEIFNRAQVAHAAAGLGLLPEQVTNDFSSMASDRVWRAAATDQVPLIEFEQWSKVIGMMSQRVWEQFVARAVACEMWTPPAGVPASKWTYPEWTPPRLMHTHPLQDVRSLKEAEELGVTSKRRIAGAMGHNLKTIERERAKEAASARDRVAPVEPTDQQAIADLKAAVADLQARLDDRG